MADWKDGFRKGSFRGVPFEVLSHQFEGGRRKQDREFAQRDNGFSDDLGRKLRKFNVEMYIIGDNYMAQRNALVRALEAEGPGELVHPYLGTFQVQAGVFTESEQADEGRMARFVVAFSEAGTPKFPERTLDNLELTRDAASAFRDNSKSFFETVFSIAAAPAFVVDSAAAAVTAAVDFAESAVAKVTNPVTDFTFAVRNLKSSINDLMAAPELLAQRLEDAFSILMDEFQDSPEVLNDVFGNFSDLEDETAFESVDPTTPSRTVEGNNNNAILNLTKELALANRAEASVDVDFQSSRDAVETRDAIIGDLESQLNIADDDNLFQSIKDLQALLIEALPREDTDDLINFTPVKTMPALVISHRLFENLEKETEILEQNEIEHPGFVPGGDSIEVSAS